MKKLIEEIKKVAAKETYYELSEDFDPGNGGNYDDAYSYGENDGEIYFARDLLSIIKKEGYDSENCKHDKECH